MFVTGGVGATHAGERFTFDYDMPDETAYAETCAAIALVFFAHRMLQVEADGRYADVMERALYNGVLSGISLDGERFFYRNPLAAHPGAFRDQGGLSGSQRWTLERQEWYGCACCPPNIARLLASLGDYAYSQGRRNAWVHLYVGGRASMNVDGHNVELIQATGYPWKETVRITVRPDAPLDFALNLRIPAWCRKATLKVNGRSVVAETKKGYARIRRTWQRGDRVELRLAMPAERIEAHPRARQTAGRVALQRGPVVYCLEEADNGADLHGIVLPRNAVLRVAQQPKMLGAVPVITAKARRVDGSDWRSTLYRPAGSKTKPHTLRAVPYFLWANRKPGEMRVWIRE
jgi:DUF1680 family protein